MFDYKYNEDTDKMEREGVSSFFIVSVLPIVFLVVFAIAKLIG